MHKIILNKNASKEAEGKSWGYAKPPYNRFKRDKVEYIQSYNEKEKQGETNICGVLVEFKVKKKKSPWKLHFFEVQCMETELGWVIVDNIGHHSFRKINRDIIERRKTEFSKK